MSKNPVTGLVTQTPTVSAVTQYSQYDAVGGQMSWTISSDASLNNGGGITADLIVIDKDKQNAPLVVFFFDQSFTPTADNSPLAIDLTNCIGFIEVLSTDYRIAGTLGNVAEVYKTKALKPATAGATTIYAQAEYYGSASPKWSATTGRLIIKLGLVQD